MGTLIPFWFIVIAVLWTGFFVLEGFDFGVGMLHSVVGRDDVGRRAAINTIGPLWDGNEVWLIVAGASMFAAFPGWYATMFSGLYLAMVLLLISLIIRGVAFEYRGKRDAAQWRRTWDVALTVGSLLAPFVIGVGAGRPAARAADQLQPELHRLILGSVPAVRGAHRGHAGADLPAARRDVPVSEDHRQHARAVRAAGPAGGAVHRRGGDRPSPSGRTSPRRSTFFLRPLELLAILAVLAAVWLVYEHRDGFAFAATAVTMASCIVSIFVGLYPNVMVSSTNPAYSLTVHNTASAPYSLHGDDRRRRHLPAAGAGLSDAGRTTCSGGG